MITGRAARFSPFFILIPILYHILAQKSSDYSAGKNTQWGQGGMRLSVPFQISTHTQPFQIATENGPLSLPCFRYIFYLSFIQSDSRGVLGGYFAMMGGKLVWNYRKAFLLVGAGMYIKRTALSQSQRLSAGKKASNTKRFAFEANPNQEGIYGY